MFLRGIGSENATQIAAITIGCLSSCISGLIIAWPSPFIVKITNDKENYDITEDQASLFTVLNLIGAVVAFPFASLFPDKFGRKPTLLISAVPYAICFSLKLFFRDVYVLYCARFIGGVGDAFLLSSLTVYIGEIASPQVRGVWGNGLIVSGYFGQFLMNVLGTYLTVQETSGVCLTVPVLFVILFSFMPESPYYYAMKDRDEDVKKSLRILRRKENVDQEYETLKSDVSRQMSESGTMKDLILIRSNRRSLIAGMFLRISQMLSGLFVFVSYTQFIFSKAGTNIDSFASAIIYTGVGTVFLVCASYCAEKLGRRKSLIVSYCLTSAMLILEGFYFLIDKYYPEIDISGLNWFPLVGMILFFLFSSFGVTIIPILMLGELFSASIKSKAIAITMETFEISYISMNILFYYLTSALGICAPFFFFGCCNVVSAVLVVFIVPETKGKTLEEIQQNLKL